MAANSKEKSDGIRVIKRKNEHGGHHGGAWKVAYADFVTAMMAFFLVMWIVGLGKDIKEAVAGYFKDPIGFMAAAKAGKIAFKVGDGGGNANKPQQMANAASYSLERDRLKKAKDAIEKAILNAPEFKDLKSHIEIKMVNEGLRVDLLDDKKSLFFDSGSAKVKPAARTLLARIAGELKNVSNPIIFEGHTDPRPLAAHGPEYTNWELSADRANSARRIMQSAGLHPGQVAQVRGYAATQPRDPGNPMHFSNRRVSIIVVLTNALPSQQFGSGTVSRPAKTMLTGNSHVLL